MFAKIRNLINVPLTSLDKKIWLLGILVFLIIRLINLTIIPIFTDEAIYIRWSEIAWRPNLEKLGEARTSIFIPLSDGKQPLFMWLAGIPMQFTTDHLWAGRLPSIISGLFSMIGLWLVAYELFKRKKIAYIASFIYMVLPFTLLYDRMMLADSMLAMWGIYAIYCGLLLIRSQSWRIALILGLIYGLGLLTKSPAIFFIALAPLSLLFFNKISTSGQLNLQKLQIWKWPLVERNSLIRWIMLWLGAAIMGQAIQSSLRLSNMYHMIGRKNLEFVVTWQEFIQSPFTMFYGNLVGTSRWFYDYLGIVLVVCSALAIIAAIKRRDIRIAFLAIVVIVPWFTSISAAKVLYPRYLLFFTPPLLLIIAYGIEFVSDKLASLSRKITHSPRIPQIVSVLTVLLLSSYSIYSSYLILFNPPAAPLPLQDREQYIVGWPSGYGLEEIYTFLRKEYTEKGSIAIGTEGTFGLMPFALQIKFYDDIYNHQADRDKLFISGYWPFDRVPQEIVEKSVGRPAYFVVYQTENDPPPNFPLELIMKIDKPDKKASMRLYKITPVWRYTPEGAIKSQ